MRKEELYNIVFDTPELKEYVENKDKEIERLNNIIDNFNNWLIKMEKYFKGSNIEEEYTRAINKLQELKGEDKE